MNFLELIAKRRSTRGYQNKSLDQQQLDKILDACNMAPSAGNLQSYKIVVVQTGTIKAQIAKASNGQEFIANAGAVLVFFANPPESAKKYSERGASLYCIQDATIAASYAQLAAAEMGLGAVWVGAFDAQEIHKICGAEKELIPVAIIPIGYVDSEYKYRPFARKSIQDFVRFL